MSPYSTADQRSRTKCVYFRLCCFCRARTSGAIPRAWNPNPVPRFLAPKICEQSTGRFPHATPTRIWSASGALKERTPALDGQQYLASASGTRDLSTSLTDAPLLLVETARAFLALLCKHYFDDIKVPTIEVTAATPPPTEGLLGGFKFQPYEGCDLVKCPLRAAGPVALAGRSAWEVIFFCDWNVCSVDIDEIVKVPEKCSTRTSNPRGKISGSQKCVYKGSTQ